MSGSTPREPAAVPTWGDDHATAITPLERSWERGLGVKVSPR